jgi:diaminopimelate epimerase
VNFVKMQGTGNDFVFLDDFNGEYNGKESELAIELCNRNFGIGADGLILVRKTEVADAEMVITNCDGSYASMCGNAIRCFAKYVWENNIIRKDEIKILTGDGIKIAYVNVKNDIVESVKINMGIPSFDTEKIPCTIKEEVIDRSITVDEKEYKITSVLMGVPHTVVITNLDDIDVKEGSKIEKCEFFPQGTNVNFCEVVDRENVKVKTWERGAGPTLACGTGCSGTVVAANKLGLVDKKVYVKSPGGTLCIEITDAGVFMTGPAKTVFKGEYFK